MQELAKKKEAEAQAKLDAEKAEGDKKGTDDVEKVEGIATEVKKEEEEEKDVKVEIVEEKDAVKEEEPKDEVKEEEAEEDESEQEEPEDPEEPRPEVSLSEEESRMWFGRPAALGIKDLTAEVAAKAFKSFCLPAEDEGFDDLQYEWQPEKESSEYLHKWVLQQKLMARIEDILPGSWFKDNHGEWIKTLAKWQAKQREYKTSAAKKNKDELAKKKDEAIKKAETDGVTIELNDEMLSLGDEHDIHTIKDICDVGHGEPLFANFAFEDWALLQLRVELYLMQVAYAHDSGDADRVGIHETNLAFYYSKYFKKQLILKFFSCSTLGGLLSLVGDAVRIDAESQVLVSVLSQVLDTKVIFESCVRLVEDVRRERQRRVDAGDETARIKFPQEAMRQPAAQIAVEKPKVPIPKPAPVQPANHQFAMFQQMQNQQQQFMQGMMPFMFGGMMPSW